MTANTNDGGRAGRNAQGPGTGAGSAGLPEEIKSTEPNRLTAENLAQLRPSDKAEFAETERKLNIHTLQEA